MRSGFALAVILLLCAPATAGSVPHVGCLSDGQLGPQAAPRGLTREIPVPDATRLADYVMADGTRTLAPRGWLCSGLYGSDGSVLFVAPDAATLKALLAGRPIAGAAVVRRMTSGGTSGRFEVARVAAMLFPAAARFVAEVEAEGIDGPYRHGIPAGDRVTRISTEAALYTTPPGVHGIGTRGGFAPGAPPVDGLAVMDLGGDHDLDMMEARLLPADRPLVADVIADIRRMHGLASVAKR